MSANSVARLSLLALIVAVQANGHNGIQMPLVPPASRTALHFTQTTLATSPSFLSHVPDSSWPSVQTDGIFATDAPVVEVDAPSPASRNDASTQDPTAEPESTSVSGYINKKPGTETLSLTQLIISGATAAVAQLSSLFSPSSRDGSTQERLILSRNRRPYTQDLNPPPGDGPLNQPERDPPFNHDNNQNLPVEDVEGWEIADTGVRSQDLLKDEIPDYVLQFAPLVYLFSDEKFWPCDIADHLRHTAPHLNYTPVGPSWDRLSLTDLDKLNYWGKGRHIFLTSDDNVEDRPAWLEGKKNIPEQCRPPPWRDPNRPTGDAAEVPSSDYQMHSKSFKSEDPRYNDRRSESPDVPEPMKPQTECKRREKVGLSEAAATLIVVDKGNDIVDAFWFYFYSYNLGNVVLNYRFGNHVGDWEHSLVRFHRGKPKAIYVSQHASGDAYTYKAVSKMRGRPVVYSASGTHAVYVTAGKHPYVLPWGLLHDKTDHGPIWDPALNFRGYIYNHVNDTLHASNLTLNAPTEWFYFGGHWGDKIYPLSDSRQYRFAGQYHYVSGPLGPWFKNLGRESVCQRKGSCTIKDRIESDRAIRHWQNFDQDEGTNDEDAEFLGG